VPLVEPALTTHPFTTVSSVSSQTWPGAVLLAVVSWPRKNLLPVRCASPPRRGSVGQVVDPALVNRSTFTGWPASRCTDAFSVAASAAGAPLQKPLPDVHHSNVRAPGAWVMPRFRPTRDWVKVNRSETELEV